MVSMLTVVSTIGTFLYIFIEQKIKQHANLKQAELNRQQLLEQAKANQKWVSELH
jgi:hypothetical protein